MNTLSTRIWIVAIAVLATTIVAKSQRARTPDRDKYNVSGVINPEDAKYGAKCDGVTDDSVAFQAALDDLAGGGNAMIIPPSSKGCLIGKVLNYPLGRQSEPGPTLIYGLGPTSKLVTSSPFGGLSIKGIPHVSGQVYLQNFQLRSTHIDNEFGLDFVGIAGFGITNLQIFGYKQGIRLIGSQQGYIKGLDGQNNISIVIDDGEGIASNGVEISGSTLFDNIANVVIEGGASDTYVVNNHFVVNSTEPAINVIFNQNSGSGGRGPLQFHNNHVENFGKGQLYNIDVRRGWAFISGSTLSTNLPTNSVHIASGAVGHLTSNGIVGGVLVDSGAQVSLFNNNMLGPLVSNTAPSNTYFQNNRNKGAPPNYSPNLSGISPAFISAGADKSTQLIIGEGGRGNPGKSAASILLNGSSSAASKSGIFFQQNGAREGAIGISGLLENNADNDFGVYASRNLKFYTDNSRTPVVKIATTGQLQMPGFYTSAGILQNDASGNITTLRPGLSVTKTIRAAGGTADCVLVFTNGLLTGGTC